MSFGEQLPHGSGKNYDSLNTKGIAMKLSSELICACVAVFGLPLQLLMGGEAITKLETSPQPEEIHDAYKEILNLNNDIGMRLIKIAEQVADDERAEFRKTFAIRLLGELRYVQASDTLVNQIMFRPKPMLSEEWRTWEQYYISAVSLKKIGYPAVSSILREMRNHSVQENKLHLFAWVLLEIMGNTAALDLILMDVAKYPHGWNQGSKAISTVKLIQNYPKTRNPPWENPE